MSAHIVLLGKQCHLDVPVPWEVCPICKGVCAEGLCPRECHDPGFASRILHHSKMITIHHFNCKSAVCACMCMFHFIPNSKMQVVPIHSYMISQQLTKISKPNWRYITTLHHTKPMTAEFYIKSQNNTICSF